MTIARRKLIDPETTPYYHVINRCVRRAFLCGDDPYTGQSYEHRRGWIVDKIKQLSKVFCIDVCAYAVMNNHYHLVLKIDIDKQKSLSMYEVISHWTQLFSGNHITNKFLKNEGLHKAEYELLDKIVEEWKERLGSISWFMRCLNEEIARKANKEDQCKGVFWEGRFKSQALLDEEALLSCMMYVDLNPIRAGLTTQLQDSDFTSIQERIRDISFEKQEPKGERLTSKIGVLPFIGSEHKEKSINGINFYLKDYLELIDWTGRAVRPDKKGYVPAQQPKLLQQLNIDVDTWVNNTSDFMSLFSSVSGKWTRMCQFKRKIGGHWCKGKQASEGLYPK